MIVNGKCETASYEIIIESGALKKIASHFDLNRKVFIITDSGVPKQYAEAVANECREFRILTLPEGEGSKTASSLDTVLHCMLEFGVGRSDCVVAVGGGVVGDLSGFAASCYMRGIDFYNIPTTLLSQVDSSIGGKTAIDFGGVKNSVGAFKMPKKVVIDPSLLKTLDERQLNSGFAEVIKMAATCDANLFEILESDECGVALAERIIYPALYIKKRVVEKDPYETGLRRVLNFGHTVGHAIEALSFGNMLHGECVALGMLAMCSDGVRRRLSALYEKFSLPTKTEFTVDEILPLVSHDKKKSGKGITSVWVDEVGSFEFKELGLSDIADMTEVLL